MSHVFISYSRHNRAYARLLADHLRVSGFDVWMDDRIDYGSRWVDVIQQAVEDCAAFVVIMTPQARASQWVQTECEYAAQRAKRVFPLLLEGEVFFRYVSVQAVDVRDGSLPPDAFLDELAENAPRRTDPGINVAPPNQAVGGEPTAGVGVEPIGRAARSGRRPIMLASALLILMLLAGALAALWAAVGRDDPDDTDTSPPLSGPTPTQTEALSASAQRAARGEDGCTYNWFFGDEYAVPDECPASDATEFSGMIQNFGGGVLLGLMLSTYGDARYVVLESGGTYQDIADYWTEEMELVGNCVLPSVADVLTEAEYDGRIDDIIGCPVQPVQFTPLHYQARDAGADFVVYIGASSGPVYRFAAPSSRPETPGEWQQIR